MLIIFYSIELIIENETTNTVEGFGSHYRSEEFFVRSY